MTRTRSLFASGSGALVKMRTPDRVMVQRSCSAKSLLARKLGKGAVASARAAVVRAKTARKAIEWQFETAREGMWTNCSRSSEGAGGRRVDFRLLARAGLSEGGQL